MKPRDRIAVGGPSGARGWADQHHEDNSVPRRDVSPSPTVSLKLQINFAFCFDVSNNRINSSP